MTSHSEHTHIRDMLLEHATWSLLVAGYDVLVTLAFQPFAETKLDK